MKELFIKYEEFSGRTSLIRFIKFINKNANKLQKSKIEKLYNEFIEEVRTNEMYVKKDYNNFRSFILSK